MPISGSTQAPLLARVGVARVGAIRLGFVGNAIILHLNGIDRTALRHVRVAGLTVRDVLDSQPNTATLRVAGFLPSAGHEIVIRVGARVEFGGRVLTVAQLYEVGNPANVAYDLTCISYEWQLNRSTYSGRFLSTSATEIVEAIMADEPAFDLDGLEAGLDVLDEMTFTNESKPDALDRVARRIGGHWLIEYGEPRPVLHFGIALAPGASPINPITDADVHSMAALVVTTDLSQVRTRVLVEGGGSNVPGDVLAGDTLLPVEDPAWYNPAGGRVSLGPQRVDYAGVTLGGGGALVGAFVVPTNALTLTPRVAGTLAAAVYQYGLSFYDATGESTLGPTATVDLTNAAAASPGAPSGALAFGGNLGTGVYRYACAFGDASGNETTLGPEVVLTLGGAVSPPSSIGSAAGVANLGEHLVANTSFYYQSTFRGPGGVETTGGPTAAFTMGNFYGVGRLTKSGNPTPPAGFTLQFYRAKTSNFGADDPQYGPRRLPGSSNDGFSSADGTYYYDAYRDGSFDMIDQLGAAIPSTSTAVYRSVTLTLPTTSEIGITTINIYRTAVDGTQKKRVAVLAIGTGSYLDTLADGSLGVDAPTANAIVQRQVLIAGLAVGPSGTVGRKLYRTEANAGQLKLLATIANNTATSYGPDTAADGSLGANAPTVNTSGLTDTRGTVPAGSTSMIVTSTGPFEAGGGWARIANMFIRYTGHSAGSLTGIPAADVGAIPATLNYGTEIVALPMLTGIPASGPGAILYPVPRSEQANLLVTRDALDAQATMSALLSTVDMPHDGAIEEYLQDNRLSEAEAISRGDARLLEAKDPLVSVRYETRDTTTRAGREVTIALGPPTGISGTFRVQSVTVSDFDPLGRTRPRRVVEASSRRFTLEALLRLIKAS